MMKRVCGAGLCKDKLNGIEVRIRRVYPGEDTASSW
jgi:hypothetical protein